MGHQNVTVLDGGLPEWISQKFPVEAIPENPNYSIANFEAEFNPELVKSI